MLFASATLWQAHRCRARFSTRSKAPQKLTVIMAPSNGLPKLETLRQGRMPRETWKALPIFGEIQHGSPTPEYRLRLSLSLTEQIDAEVMMKSDRNKMALLFTLPAIAVLSTSLLWSTGPRPLRAQEVDLVKVDFQIVWPGYRTSKLAGRTVVNDLNEKIGTLDDVIVTKEHDIFIPVQVGGFLGVGSRLVVLPFDAFKIDDRKIVLPNASKEQLKKLADFKYAS